MGKMAPEKAAAENSDLAVETVSSQYSTQANAFNSVPQLPTGHQPVESCYQLHHAARARAVSMDRYTVVSVPSEEDGIWISKMAQSSGLYFVRVGILFSRFAAFDRNSVEANQVSLVE